MRTHLRRYAGWYGRRDAEEIRPGGRAHVDMAGAVKPERVRTDDRLLERYLTVTVTAYYVPCK